MHWTSTTDFAAGGCSKGGTTLCLLRFFLTACRKRAGNIPEGCLLRVCYKAGQSINLFFKSLSRHELWIPRDQALELAQLGFDFLRYYGMCAQQAHSEGRALFMFMPNLHRMHHVFCDLLDQSRCADYCLSPAATMCPMEEDFIGRPSRVSRRVSPQTISLRTLRRALQAAYAQYVKCGWPAHFG